MMKTIVAINECDFGSTGTIAKDVLDFCKANGYQTYFVANRIKGSNHTPIKINSFFPLSFLNRIICRIDGSDGFHNKITTRHLLKKISKIKPDVIHLHNIHGRYINLPLILKYCLQNNTKIIWTLHDCWAFTGRCPHFEYVKCGRWKGQCGKCPAKNIYPKAYLFDRSKKLLKKKVELINSVSKLLTLVSPSHWLDNLVGQSRMKNINHVAIHNGIDPININFDKNIYRKKNNLVNKKVFFGASFGYDKRKGIEFISQLADELDTNKYAFILAGLDDKQQKDLSQNIIQLGMVSKEKMFEMYSAADAFINSTLEDNFPTVNLESLSCGTPVITFATGGSGESISDETGVVIEHKDFDNLKKTVLHFDSSKYSSDKCKLQARKFSKKEMVKEYFKIIENTIKN